MEGLAGIYLTQMTHGLVYGMLIFLVAAGFTLVFGMMDVLNVAHAIFYMLGAYFSYTLTPHLHNFWLSLIICPVIVGVIGVLIAQFLILKIHKEGHIAELILTFGLFYIMAELIYIIWGTDPLTVTVPTLLSGDIPLMGSTYPVYRLFILVFSFLVLIAMVLVLMRTRIGIIVRAAVSDADMLGALGTNVPVVFVGVCGAGAVLAGIAGVIAAPFLGAYPQMGMDMLMECFVVIVVGGFGSLLGALIAALMIGELHSFGILWIPRLAMVFPFLLMALVLIIRPTGLFGEKE